MLRAIRVTPELELVVRGAVTPLAVNEAFGLARDLLRHGARAVVREEAAKEVRALERRDGRSTQ